MKAHELRLEGKQTMLEKLKKLRQELAQLRVHAKTGGAAARVAKIRGTRKSIARVLTVLNQKERENTKKALKGKTFKPPHLRPRLTHAKRVALKSWELARKTSKQVKAAAAFPQRKFAIKL